MTDIFLIEPNVNIVFIMWTKSNIRLSDLAESLRCGTVGSKVSKGEKHLNNLILRG